MDVDAVARRAREDTNHLEAALIAAHSPLVSGVSDDEAYVRIDTIRAGTGFTLIANNLTLTPDLGNLLLLPIGVFLARMGVLRHRANISEVLGEDSGCTGTLLKTTSAALYVWSAYSATKHGIDFLGSVPAEESLSYLRMAIDNIASIGVLCSLYAETAHSIVQNARRRWWEH